MSPPRRSKRDEPPREVAEGDEAQRHEGADAMEVDEPAPALWYGWKAEDGPDTKYYLIKWRGLGYDGCTWEVHPRARAMLRARANGARGRMRDAR